MKNNLNVKTTNNYIQKLSYKKYILVSTTCLVNVCQINKSNDQFIILRNIPCYVYI